MHAASPLDGLKYLNSHNLATLNCVELLQADVTDVQPDDAMIQLGAAEAGLWKRLQAALCPLITLNTWCKASKFS